MRYHKSMEVYKYLSKLRQKVRDRMYKYMGSGYEIKFEPFSWEPKPANPQSEAEVAYFNKVWHKVSQKIQLDYIDLS